jgi:hypothetical protein
MESRHAKDHFLNAGVADFSIAADRRRASKRVVAGFQ